MRNELKKIIEEANIIKIGKQMIIINKHISNDLKEKIIQNTKECRDNLSERIYWILNDIYKYPTCIECGKEFKPKYYGLSTKSFNERRFCSTKCTANNKEIKARQKQTLKINYGVENVFQLPKVKDKIKQTNLERYGVENAAQSPEIQNKIKQTNLQRYGVENCLQNEEILIKNQKRRTKKLILSSGKEIYYQRI